jgi:hypothetical protein
MSPPTPDKAEPSPSSSSSQSNGDNGNGKVKRRLSIGSMLFSLVQDTTREQKCQTSILSTIDAKIGVLEDRKKDNEQLKLLLNAQDTMIQALVGNVKSMIWLLRVALAAIIALGLVDATHFAGIWP